MSTGNYVRLGSKMGTTYPEKGECLFDLIDDFYKAQYSIAKSAGAATYGDNGYFNAIMGKEITAAMFASDNIWTCIGARPYPHEGVRLALNLASYGLNAAGKFVGLGAGTVQDGAVPESVQMPVNEYRQPAKDLPFAFDYGLYLQAVENKDDTIAYKDYIDKMANNYSNLADQTILRSIKLEQPTVNGVETSLNGIARCLSSFAEKAILEAELGISDATSLICPYGGANGDYGERAQHASNLDGKLVNIKGGALAIEDLRKLYRKCSVNWIDSAAPNNKMWSMSPVAIDKAGALLMANNLYLDEVMVQRDFNGVKTMPGRDAGMTLNGFNKIPIILDGNINFDFDTFQVSDTVYGDIGLYDLDHMWISMLTPIEMFTFNNPAATRMMVERHVMSMRAELRTDSYIGSGRIINIADEVA